MKLCVYAAQSAPERLASLVACSAGDDADALCRLEAGEDEEADSCASAAPVRALQESSRCPQATPFDAPTSGVMRLTGTAVQGR